MRVKNTSIFDISELKRLLNFAARGVRDNGVEIHIKNSRAGWHGNAYPELPSLAKVASKTEYLITLRMPKEYIPEITWTPIVGINRLWPQGIPLDSWQDIFLFIAAHEFRHIWQFQRTARTGRAGKGEYDCEKFAHSRLNQWRQATDRQPVLPIKQPNPFLDSRASVSK